MSSIKVLDVTLRDGGCVNNFNFGQPYMDMILSSLEQSGVDFVEMGYLDQKSGSENGRTQYCNERVIYENFLKNKKDGVTYVAMMDYGKFDPLCLEECNEKSIDGIRVAFHKKNWKDVITLGRIIIDKGYQLYIQPMLTMRYSDAELLQLVEAVNAELPDASGFYIVDSFGEMRHNDVVRLMHLVDHNLLPSITMGFHSHNNLQLSYSNAMALLEFPTRRSLMLDSSVMGMGKGAGNLNTELLLEHLNLYYQRDYKIAPLLALIDQVINVLHKEMYWGYSAEYYLSSIHHCTPSYAGHFYNKHMLPIDQVSELLGMIAEDKRGSFDKAYAEELYRSYNAQKKYDDAGVIEELTKQFSGKRILLIAPGKSIALKAGEIKEIIKSENVVSVALNNMEFEVDYILATRFEMYEQALKHKRKVIVPSNVYAGNSSQASGVFVIDYDRWIVVDEGIHDASGVIIMQMLKTMLPSEILLAGFDGFSANINENYHSEIMRKPVSEEQAVRRNRFFKQYFSEMKQLMALRFITKSMYE